MTVARDIHEQIGEPVVCHHGKQTYRPVGDFDQSNYPDEVEGYQIDDRQS